MSRLRPRLEKRKLQKLHYQLEWPRAKRYQLREMIPILEKLTDKNFDSQLRMPLVKYLIIANVSVIEDFMSNLTRRIIDENNLDVSELIDDRIKKFLAEKELHKLTKGQVIAMSYSYANFDHLEFVFTKLLKFSLKWYVQTVSEEDPAREIKGAMYLHKNWSKFEEMFNTRNEIVHAMAQIRVSNRTIVSLCDNTLSFMEITNTLQFPDYCREMAQRYQRES